MQTCVQHSENIADVDGRYGLLWSKVDHLLDCCNKLLQLTRPEVEALKEGTQHQLSAVFSQADARGSDRKVTSADAQVDIQVTDSQTAAHNLVQHESLYSGTHVEAQFACENTGAENAERALCSPIAAERSAGGSLAAGEQISEDADFHPTLSLQDQTISEPNKQSAHKLLVVRPSDVTRARKTETPEKSSSLFKDAYYPTIVYLNDQTMTDKDHVAQDCNIITISLSSTDISMSSKSLVSPLAQVHTPNTCHVESVIVNEPTFPVLQMESNEDKDSVLVLEVLDEKEINVIVNHTEDSPSVTTEVRSSIVTEAGSHAVEHMPHNTVIIVAEGKASQALSSVADI